MKGAQAICPASGSSLSQDRHYVDEQTRPLRVPEDDHTYGDPSYELTTGERCSSKMALMNFIRRVHAKQHDEDDPLYQRAALALRRLKADEGETRDEWILFALAERLHQLGYDADWLRSNIDPVCPQCGGKLKWEVSPRGASARCGTYCDGGSYQNWEIRVRVRTTFNSAFPDDAVEELTVL